MKRRTCLFLDDESIIFLDEFKYETKKSKSEIVRKLLHYFSKNEEELKNILKDGS